MTQETPIGRLFEAVIKAIPYPDQMTDIDLTQQDSIRFTWRQSRYRVSERGHCETVERGCLIGDDKSILMQELIRRQLVAMDIADFRAKDNGK